MCASLAQALLVQQGQMRVMLLENRACSRRSSPSDLDTERVTDMPVAWKTKYGGRRVRHDPPTIEEALEAAQCFTEDQASQIEVAAQLMGVSEDEVRAVALRAQRRATTIQRVAPASPSASGRAVIVERRTTRRRIAAP